MRTVLEIVSRRGSNSQPHEKANSSQLKPTSKSCSPPILMKTLDQNSSAGVYSARNMAKPVHFFCEAPTAQAVHLVGDFNGWNPTAELMTRRVDGWWFAELDLTHGHHRYRFIVDGKPRLDPRATGTARDEKGEEASMVAVS